MNRNELDQFKRMLRALAAIILMVGMAGIFLFIWKTYYNMGVVFPFYNKGHWFIMAVYVIFLIIFFYIYGGLKFGYLKCASIILSQVLATVCANVLAYLEIVLLSARFASVVPILVLTLVDMAVIIIWAIFVTVLFKKIFPPRKMLLLFEEYNPSLMECKIKRRDDRYKIEMSQNIQ